MDGVVSTASLAQYLMAVMVAAYCHGSGVRLCSSSQSKKRTVLPLHHPARRPARHSAHLPVRAAAAENRSKVSAGLSYDHVMLALFDANPYLSDGSKQATAMAAEIASTYKSRMTVLLVDEKSLEGDAVTRMDVLTGQLKEAGCTDFQVVDQIAPASASAALGDVADEQGADLLLLSCDAVHSKAVDANLLAEFVPCPIMLLP